MSACAAVPLQQRCTHASKVTLEQQCSVTMQAPLGEGSAARGRTNQRMARADHASEVASAARFSVYDGLCEKHSLKTYAVAQIGHSMRIASHALSHVSTCWLFCPLYTPFAHNGILPRCRCAMVAMPLAHFASEAACLQRAGAGSYLISTVMVYVLVHACMFNWKQRYERCVLARRGQ
jgi:hypothetical protein